MYYVRTFPVLVYVIHFDNGFLGVPIILEPTEVRYNTCMKGLNLGLCDWFVLVGGRVCKEDSAD